MIKTRGGGSLAAALAIAPTLRHDVDMTRPSVVIAWNRRANAYVARMTTRAGELARGATLSETARKLAEAIDPAVQLDAVFRKVAAFQKAHKVKPLSMKEIDAEIKIYREERARRRRA